MIPIVTAKVRTQVADPNEFHYAMNGTRAGARACASAPRERMAAVERTAALQPTARRERTAGLGRFGRLAPSVRFRWIGVAVAALAAIGCSPAYDWREVRADDDGFVVLLPAKPARMTRPVNLDGLRVDMTMRGAQAGQASFTVGAVALPDQGEVARKAADAMRIAMVRNIGGTERASRPVSVPIVDAQGKPVGTATGVEVEAAGRMREQPATLLARFVTHERQAWQCVVLGPQVDREQAAVFLDSFRVLRR